MTVTSTARPSLRPKYQTSPVRYAIMRWVIGTLMRIIYRYEIRGIENVPASGPVILAVNHLHILDPAVVAPAVPRQIVTLAAEKWRRHALVDLFLRAAGSIYVARGEVDRHALRDCLAVLHDEGMLAIAVEGTRSKTGAMQRARPGVAYLATRTNAIVVPAAFWGVERVGEWKRFRRPRCVISFGEPFRVMVGKERPSSEALQGLADAVGAEIARLLPVSYRGVYAPAVQGGARDSRLVQCPITAP